MTRKHTLYISAAAGALVLLMLIAKACDRGPQSALKGQNNASLTFYGRTVDQDGAPLDGVEFEFDVEAIPKGWTFDTRGKPHDHLTMSARSGPDGQLSIKLTGHVLRFNKVS